MRDLYINEHKHFEERIEQRGLDTDEFWDYLALAEKRLLKEVLKHNVTEGAWTFMFNQGINDSRVELVLDVYGDDIQLTTVYEDIHDRANDSFVLYRSDKVGR